MSVEVNPLLARSQWSPLSVERYTPSPQPAVPAKMSSCELIASDQMRPQFSPLSFRCVQFSPSSVDRQTPPAVPPAYVPAKMWPDEFIANARTSTVITPWLTAVQLFPLSVDRNMPIPYVPAKMVLSVLIAKARTSVAIRPLFFSTHESPLSLDRKTPPPTYVPVKMSPF